MSMDREEGCRDDPDVQGMLAFQNGNDRAFEALFRRHSLPLLNFSNRMLGNRERAEEIVQEVFLEIYRARGRYRPEARFSTWVYRIATNRCLNELRRPEHYRITRNSREEEPGSEPAGPAPRSNTPDASQILEGRRLEAAIEKSVSDLPGPQRSALILCRYHATGYREAAEVMETTEAAVKSLIHRATVTLRDKLKVYLK